MNANKALWEKGDFTRIAETMRESGEALVKELGYHQRARRSGSRVRRRDHGAAGGHARSQRARSGHRRQSGGRPETNGRASSVSPTAGSKKVTPRTSTDIDDEQFDLVVTIFGAMFAPKPFDVAKEMVRVDAARRPDRHGELDPRRPDTGGPDPADQLRLLTTAARRVRQPDDVGDRGQASIERFAAAGVPEDHISFERATYRFTYGGTPSELLDQFRAYYGPTMNAFEAAAADGREAELRGRAGGTVHDAERQSERRMSPPSPPRSCSSRS